MNAFCTGDERFIVGDKCVEKACLNFWHTHTASYLPATSKQAICRDDCYSRAGGSEKALIGQSLVFIAMIYPSTCAVQVYYFGGVVVVKWIILRYAGILVEQSPDLPPLYSQVLTSQNRQYSTLSYSPQSTQHPQVIYMYMWPSMHKPTIHCKMWFFRTG